MQAETAIKSYGVHCVVANLLETRKEHVLVIKPPWGSPDPDKDTEDLSQVSHSISSSEAHPSRFHRFSAYQSDVAGKKASFAVASSAFGHSSRCDSLNGNLPFLCENVTVSLEQ